MYFIQENQSSEIYESYLSVSGFSTEPLVLSKEGSIESRKLLFLTGFHACETPGFDPDLELLSAGGTMAGLGVLWEVREGTQEDFAGLIGFGDCSPIFVAEFDNGFPFSDELFGGDTEEFIFEWVLEPS